MGSTFLIADLGKESKIERCKQGETMPLKSTSVRRHFDFDRKAVGIWMEVEGEEPTRPVRVFVTPEALSSLDPHRALNADGALATFDTYYKRIHRAASSKFDEGKFSHDEGDSVIIIRDHDL